MRNRTLIGSVAAGLRRRRSADTAEPAPPPFEQAAAPAEPIPSVIVAETPAPAPRPAPVPIPFRRIPDDPEDEPAGCDTTTAPPPAAAPSPPPVSPGTVNWDDRFPD